MQKEVLTSNKDSYNHNLALQMVYLLQWKGWKEDKWFLPKQQVGESAYVHHWSAAGSGTGPHNPPPLHKMLECYQLAAEGSDNDLLCWILVLECHSEISN